MKQSYIQKSKPSDHYQTPERVFDILHEQGLNAKHFFDPCPFHSSFDGLEGSWHKWNYVNPPYSLLEKFIEKAYDEFENKNNFSILLLPVKSDKDWWHDYIIKPHFNFKIIWIRGRLKFKNTNNPSPNPHCLVVMQ